jgi:V/A-type H+/Na+-transporting ATPase subunit C
MADYGYANARIRGMKSLLIKGELYNRLLKTKSLADVVANLSATPYQRELSEAMIKGESLKGFDEALRRNVMKAFAKISNMVDEDAQPLVNVLLGRWDVANVKAILRGKNLGASSEMILSSLIPGAEIDEAALLEMVSSRDVRDCVDTMATLRIPYAVPLTSAFPAYAAKRSLTTLEIALDKCFYDRAYSSLRGRDLSTELVRRTIGRDIDTANIMLVLRIVKEEIDRREGSVFLIDGGRELPYWRIQEFINKRNVEDVVQDLASTSYHELISENMPSYFETGTLIGLQRALEHFAIRSGLKMWHADPLTIGGIIAYIWEKTNEVVNLRVIARGKEVGMPENKMREALVLA